MFWNFIINFSSTSFVFVKSAHSASPPHTHSGPVVRLASSENGAFLCVVGFGETRSCAFGVVTMENGFCFLAPANSCIFFFKLIIITECRLGGEEEATICFSPNYMHAMLRCAIRFSFMSEWGSGYSKRNIFVLFSVDLAFRFYWNVDCVFQCMHENRSIDDETMNFQAFQLENCWDFEMETVFGRLFWSWS